MRPVPLTADFTAPTVQTMTNQATVAERRFGVRGVPTRMLLMIIGGFFLTEVLLFVTTVSGPVEHTQRRLSGLAHTIKVGDAWSFVGVFAAFVVAIQVTAWGNQQAADRIARSRSSRFTVAAVFTGSVTVACWVLFTIAFNTEATGEYLLLTCAVAAVVFFAADGASIVLRQDRREALRAEARQTVADASSVLYGEFVRLRYPVFVAFSCSAAFIAWGVLISAGGLTVLALVDIGNGHDVDPHDWTSAYVPLAIVLAFLVAGSLGSAACYFTWLSRRRRREADPGSTDSRAVYLFAAITLAVLVAAGSLYFPVSAAVQGLPWAAVIGVLVAVAGPSAIPFLALIANRRLTPKRNWWTPRGSVRLGAAAVGRSYVAYQLRGVAELDALFGDST